MSKSETITKAFEAAKEQYAQIGVDVEAAKKHIRAKFIVTMEDSVVRVSYQDKNQQVAHDILQAIIQSYRQKMDEAGRLQKAVPDDA